MYFSRISLLPEAGKVQLIRQMSKNNYQLHQLLWGMFSGESAKPKFANKNVADFIYRIDYSNDQLVIHLVSARQPNNKDGIWHIQSKPYDPALSNGQRLQFHMRVNPTITITDNGKAKRHDVMMHAKYQLQQAGNHEPDKATLWAARQQGAQHWLSKRQQQLGFTAEIPSLLIDNYRKEKIYKPGKRNDQQQANAISYNTVDLQGYLSVTDPAKFKAALYQGVGKSKAFGCGLILIRSA